MLRLLQKSRNYCKIVVLNEKGDPNKSLNDKRLDFKKLTFATKVPLRPIEQDFPNTKVDDIDIDSKTIQLLERLALVDLDSKQALETLKSSIQFANKIVNINTDGVEPLYTVLEEESLHLREDQVTEGNCRDKILKNAKVTDEDYFVSPPGNIPLEQEEKDFIKQDLK